MIAIDSILLMIQDISNDILKNLQKLGDLLRFAKIQKYFAI